MKTRDGIASHCKVCTSAWSRRYTKTTKGKQQRKVYYQRHKEKQLDRKFRRKFGITLQEYKLMLDKQGRQCMICGRTPEENGKALAVDHNHKTGIVRDLLCNNCNACLGFIENSNISVENLKQYMNKHKITN